MAHGRCQALEAKRNERRSQESQCLYNLDSESWLPNTRPLIRVGSVPLLEPHEHVTTGKNEPPQCSNPDC